MIPILMQPMFIDLVGKLYYSNLFCNYNYSNIIHGQAWKQIKNRYTIAFIVIFHKHFIIIMKENVGYINNCFH